MKNALGPFVLVCSLFLALAGGIFPNFCSTKSPPGEEDGAVGGAATAGEAGTETGTGAGTGAGTGTRTGAGTGAGTGASTGSNYVGSGKEFSPELKQYAMEMAEKYGLTNLSPSDSMKYFGHEGPATAEEWAGLMGKMVDLESGFDTNCSYTENFVNKSTGQLCVSRGLFQLSEGDFPGLTVADCYDPYKNIETATKIMARDIGSAGVINGKAAGQGNTGLARYWGIFRSGKL